MNPAPGATDAFSRSPLSRAFRPFIGPGQDVGSYKFIEISMI